MVSVVRVVGAKGMMAYKSRVTSGTATTGGRERKTEAMLIEHLGLKHTTVPISQGNGIIDFGVLEGWGNQDGTHPWVLFLSLSDAQRNIFSDVHALGP